MFALFCSVLFCCECTLQDEHLPGAKVFGPRCHRLVKRPADISLSFLDNDDLYNASLVNWVWSSLAMGPALWENRG